MSVVHEPRPPVHVTAPPPPRERGQILMDWLALPILAALLYGAVHALTLLRPLVGGGL